MPIFAMCETVLPPPFGDIGHGAAAVLLLCRIRKRRRKRRRRQEFHSLSIVWGFSSFTLVGFQNLIVSRILALFWALEFLIFCFVFRKGFVTNQSLFFCCCLIFRNHFNQFGCFVSETARNNKCTLFVRLLPTIPFRGAFRLHSHSLTHSRQPSHTLWTILFPLVEVGKMLFPIINCSRLRFLCNHFFFVPTLCRGSSIGALRFFRQLFFFNFRFLGALLRLLAYCDLT